MTTPESATRTLARFVAAARWEDLPAAVRHEAKRSLLNFFATAFSGCGDPAVRIALQVMEPLSGPRQAHVIGHAARVDLLTAAFLNAASANVQDFDDTHIPTVIHPTAPVAAALLALAETRPVTGAALLQAISLGVDVECRLGNAVSPGHYRRGWHITSTCGVPGAAAGAAKLLGLDADGVAWAIGNGAVQASGLVETLGWMAKSISVGNTARNGLLAALLAQRGFSAPDTTLEGPRGFAHVMGDEPDIGWLTRELGTRYELMNNTYKPYPCGVVLHSVIDACLALRAEDGITAGRIARVTVTGHPLLRERGDRRDVTTGRESQVSTHQSVAVAFLFGAAGPAQYSDAAVADPAVIALRAKVFSADDPSMPVGGARVAVETTDGRTVERHVPHASGSLERPLSDAALEAKLRTLAADCTPWCDTARLIDAVWSLDTSPDVAPILKLAVPPAG